MLSHEVLIRISKETGASVSCVEATVKLLEDGSTIPFIARYRKEATGNLDEVEIREIAQGQAYYSELEARRSTVLTALEKQGRLADELKQEILACYSKLELEDLFLPYRPKKKSRAGVAVERGLEPLAQYILDQAGEEPAEAYAQQFVSTDKEVPTAEEAVEGALHIISERISEKPEFRRHLRDQMLDEGVVRAKVLPGKEGQKTKYEMYYGFEDAVPKIPSHRLLAIRRGAREGILSYSVAIDSEKTISMMLRYAISNPESHFASLLERAVQDGYARLLEPSIQNEVRALLRERAESEAIRVFEENLETLLLAPPAGPIVVIGVEPGLRTGSKLAVVGASGTFLESQTICLDEPKDLEIAEAGLIELIRKHGVRGIAIGNGIASRETEVFLRSVVEKHRLDVFTVVVNEAGASAYSISKRAREEFPDLDVAVRGAISIARRLQDPLVELVKIDPKAVGVGQYQHDVDQKKLKRSLAAIVESCVNRVGVDLNTASVDLLGYVSGIDDKLAQYILTYRDQHGPFRSRMGLREVEGLGDKTFEQAAGFLRIENGDNPLDHTAIHPESYWVVDRIAAFAGVSPGALIENPGLAKSLDVQFLENEVGQYTLLDIRDELRKRRRDPREKFVAPKFRDDVKGIADLQNGMELEGIITNVTNFGAFVNLGVHQDGLVHISELSHRFIQDARHAVKVGNIVKVKVIGVDTAMKRISLSMKAVVPRPKRRHKKKSPSPRLQPLAAATKEGAASDGSQRARTENVQPIRANVSQSAVQNQGPKTPRPSGRSVKSRHLAAETAEPNQSMEEKIRLLQEKFGRAR